MYKFNQLVRNKYVHFKVNMFDIVIVANNYNESDVCYNKILPLSVTYCYICLFSSFFFPFFKITFGNTMTPYSGSLMFANMLRSNLCMTCLDIIHAVNISLYKLFYVMLIRKVFLKDIVHF